MAELLGIGNLSGRTANGTSAPNYRQKLKLAALCPQHIADIRISLSPADNARLPLKTRIAAADNPSAPHRSSPLKNAARQGNLTLYAPAIPSPRKPILWIHSERVRVRAHKLEDLAERTALGMFLDQLNDHVRQTTDAQFLHQPLASIEQP